MSDDGNLRPIFRRHLLGFDWQSIETGGTGGGVPDSNYCSRGREGWVEYKQTEGWAVTLEPAQVGWICRRVRCGGRVWIGVRRRNDGGPRRGAPVDELWLMPGKFAKEARVGGLRAMASLPGVSHWSGGEARWDWKAVAAWLRT